MRPVRASKQECLSCHTNAKLNATLGVMVYAVRTTKNNLVIERDQNSLEQHDTATDRSSPNEAVEPRDK